IISERDLGGKNGEPMRTGRKVADLMTHSLVSATSETSLHEAAELMRGHTIGCLPIMDAGHLKGIITTTDLLKIIAGSSE
ncbi:MAG: CBS domain-containing protein, partial [Planctomycetes bacterium]|nr:CBS domain-containing protein [Planctomycetota bacterium]